MKLKIKIPKRLLALTVCMASCLFLLQTGLLAQDSTGKTEVKAKPVKVKPVKNTFQGIWIIDNQTVMVPVKGTFEMDIQHRFGTAAAYNVFGLQLKFQFNCRDYGITSTSIADKIDIECNMNFNNK